MESFFSTLKSELVNRAKFKTEQDALRRIYEYIEVYYNRQRSTQLWIYQTPAEYANVSIHLTACPEYGGRSLNNVGVSDKAGGRVSRSKGREGRTTNRARFPRWGNGRVFEATARGYLFYTQ